jgi:hypothetical protein
MAYAQELVAEGLHTESSALPRFRASDKVGGIGGQGVRRGVEMLCTRNVAFAVFYLSILGI